MFPFSSFLLSFLPTAVKTRAGNGILGRSEDSSGELDGTTGSHHAGPGSHGWETLRPRHARDGGNDCRPDRSHSIEEVLAEYPYLEREDVLQALRYAA